VRRPPRLSIVVIGGLALTGTLTGCASAADDAAATGGTSTGSTEESSAPAAAPSAAAPSADASAAPAEGSAATGAYADGDYSATGEYQSPAGTESVDVSVTLEGDIVTDVTVEPNADNANSVRYQTAFAGNVADVVVGKSIDDLAVDKVAGSSLTSDGFNAAIEQIKDDAAA
jgi:uncharacterized protein with FMN-binding domain